MSKNINIGLAMPVVAASALMLMAPMLAAAANPHFIGEPNCRISGGDLVCSGKVAGLGNVEEVTASIEADVTCQNRGDNFPQGQQGGEEQTFDVDNGQITFSNLRLENPCPDRMRATFEDVALVVDGTTLPIDFP